MASKKKFDWKLLDKILQYKPSLVDTADIMEVSGDTVARRIREKYDMTFAEYRNKKMAKVRMSLVQKAIELAMNGDRTLMIFSLKNYCGWSDNPAEQLEDKSKVIQLSYNLEPEKVR